MAEQVLAAVRTAPGRIELQEFPMPPLERLTSREAALHDVDPAIRAVGGEGEDGVIHVSLLPWKDGPR